MFDALQWISDWLNSGVYTFFTEAYAYMIQKAVAGYLSFLKWAIPFAWGIAKALIDDLNLSAQLTAFWNGIPATPAAILKMMKIPEFVNVILTAGVTKIAMKFIPGL